MLSPFDAKLVDREDGLPGLSLLLDSEALTAKLNALCTNVCVLACAAVYARYKPGTSCLVCYQVHSDVGETYLYAIAFRNDQPDKLEKAHTRTYIPGELGLGALILPEHAVIIYEFPNDRRLPSLQKLATRDEQRPLLTHIFHGIPTLWEADVAILRYKPERRCVAAVRSEGGEQALLRFYAETDYPQVLRNARAFQAGDRLRISKQIGQRKSRAILALAWLHGEPLDECLQQRNVGIGWLRATGEALAELHQQRPKLDLRYTMDREATACHRAARAAAWLLPELRTRVHQLADDFQAVLTCETYPRCAIHGDFSADQVLLPDSAETDDPKRARIGILDLDRAGYGDPTADLGAFIAQLYQMALEGMFPLSTIDELAAILCDGYNRAAGNVIPSRRLRWHIAGRLLRLAPEAFRKRCTEDWPALMKATVALAEEVAYHHYFSSTLSR